jgi:hypothetical protein
MTNYELLDYDTLEQDRYDFSNLKAGTFVMTIADYKLQDKIKLGYVFFEMNEGTGLEIEREMDCLDGFHNDEICGQGCPSAEGFLNENNFNYEMDYPVIGYRKIGDVYEAGAWLIDMENYESTEMKYKPDGNIYFNSWGRPAVKDPMGLLTEDILDYFSDCQDNCVAP